MDTMDMCTVYKERKTNLFEYYCACISESVKNLETLHHEILEGLTVLKFSAWVDEMHTDVQDLKKNNPEATENTAINLVQTMVVSPEDVNQACKLLLKKLVSSREEFEHALRLLHDIHTWVHSNDANIYILVEPMLFSSFVMMLTDVYTGAVDIMRKTMSKLTLYKPHSRWFTFYAQKELDNQQLILPLHHMHYTGCQDDSSSSASCTYHYIDAINVGPTAAVTQTLSFLINVSELLAQSFDPALDAYECFPCIKIQKELLFHVPEALAKTLYFIRLIESTDESMPSSSDSISTQSKPVSACPYPYPYPYPSPLSVPVGKEYHEKKQLVMKSIEKSFAHFESVQSKKDRMFIHNPVQEALDCLKDELVRHDYAIMDAMMTVTASPFSCLTFLRVFNERLYSRWKRLSDREHHIKCLAIEHEYLMKISMNGWNNNALSPMHIMEDWLKTMKERIDAFQVLCEKVSGMIQLVSHKIEETRIILSLN